MENILSYFCRQTVQVLLLASTWVASSRSALPSLIDFLHYKHLIRKSSFPCRSQEIPIGFRKIQHELPKTFSSAPRRSRFAPREWLRLRRCKNHESDSGNAG